MICRHCAQRPRSIDIRICISHGCVGQSDWRSVILAVGGPGRTRVSARASASGSRYRSAMTRTRSVAPSAGIPAAVANSGRAEDPRTTGTEWVAVRNWIWLPPDHWDAELDVRMRTQAGSAARDLIALST
jgi:hypothetical protein